MNYNFGIFLALASILSGVVGGCYSLFGGEYYIFIATISTLNIILGAILLIYGLE